MKENSFRLKLVFCILLTVCIKIAVSGDYDYREIPETHEINTEIVEESTKIEDVTTHATNNHSNGSDTSTKSNEATSTHSSSPVKTVSASKFGSNDHSYSQNMIKSTNISTILSASDATAPTVKVQKTSTIQVSTITSIDLNGSDDSTKSNEATSTLSSKPVQTDSESKVGTTGEKYEDTRITKTQRINTEIVEESTKIEDVTTHEIYNSWYDIGDSEKSNEATSTHSSSPIQTVSASKFGTNDRSYSQNLIKSKIMSTIISTSDATPPTVKVLKTSTIAVSTRNRKIEISDCVHHSLLILNLTDLANNKIGNDDKAALARVINKNKLPIGNNSLDSFNTTVFRYIGNLIQIMDASSNQLHDMNELNTMLAYLTEVEKLTLKSNGIQNIPNLSRSKKLRELNLKNNSIRSLATLNKERLLPQQLAVLILSNNNIEVLEDYVFSNLKYLQHLDLGNNKINKISKTAFLNLVNLKNLALHGNQLKKITHWMFYGLAALEQIELAGQKVDEVEIKDHTFVYSNNLTRVFMNRNKGLKISKKAFCSFTNKHVYGKANKETHLYFDLTFHRKTNDTNTTVDQFCYYKQFETLFTVVFTNKKDFDEYTDTKCKPSSNIINEDDFCSETIDETRIPVEQCQFKECGCKTNSSVHHMWMPLPDRRVHWISEPEYDIISKLLNTGFFNSTYLSWHVQHNRDIRIHQKDLTEVNPETFNKLLQYFKYDTHKLVLEDTSLQIVPNLTLLQVVKHLSLAHNYIENLYPVCNQNSLLFPRTLKVLDLSYNRINGLNDYAFLNLDSLEYLDLKSNQIVEISENAFKNLNKLVSIDISGNKIKAITESMFAILPKLDTIYAQEQYIDSTPLVVEDYAFSYRTYLKVVLGENRFKMSRKAFCNKGGALNRDSKSTIVVDLVSTETEIDEMEAEFCLFKQFSYLFNVTIRGDFKTELIECKMSKKARDLFHFCDDDMSSYTLMNFTVSVKPPTELPIPTPTPTPTPTVSIKTEHTSANAHIASSTPPHTSVITEPVRTTKSVAVVISPLPSSYGTKIIINVPILVFTLYLTYFLQF